jgi:hypothetical protein
MARREQSARGETWKEASLGSKARYVEICHDHFDVFLAGTQAVMINTSRCCFNSASAIANNFRVTGRIGNEN